ncbi:phosphohistidine phosphatase SixA [bacterium]|nr:phosphohistidine phosphatase SixA [bacterium]
MEIYLLRHGIAENIGGKIRSDGARPLTEEGIDLMRDEAKGMKRLGLHFNVVLTSPLVRSKQTAEIVGDVLDCSNKIHNCAALAIPMSVADLMQSFKSFQNDYKVLLVGHQPDLGKLAGYFIGNSKLSLSLKKGSLCKIEVERLSPTPRGNLKWYLTPRQLKIMSQA